METIKMSTFKIARVSQLLVPVIMSWGIFFGTTASANDPGAPGVSIATGSCDSLIMSADDHTAECDARLASVTLRDGTVMFIFTANLIPIAFSGNGKRLGKGIR